VILIETATDNALTADNDDPTKILIRQILGAVAQFDKSMIVLKWKTARVRVRKKVDRREGMSGESVVPESSRFSKQLNVLLTRTR
jgi:hypothetical protein